MKIILFIDNLGSGGAQRQLVGLAVMLKNTGYDVKVSTYYPHDFYKGYLDNNNVPNEIISGADNTKKRIIAVRRYFKQERPDWVIAYQETPSIVACAAKILGCKYHLIVSERNTTQVTGKSERIRFFLYHVADAIVPNSYAQEKYLLEHHPWMKSRLKTITNYVDLEKFSFVEHIRNSKTEIIVPASLMTSKNAFGLINACAILKSQGVKFHVSWYGISEAWPEYHSSCLDMIDEHDLHEYVTILPKTKEIDKKYREADYLCLPSFFEGTPNVICEAISTGLPILCSNICDNPIYVKEGLNGALFDPHDPNDIADKIKSLLSQSDDDYEKFRKNSRSIAEVLLSDSMFIKNYLSIIHGKY